MEIPLFHTYIDPSAQETIGKVLHSTFLSEGDVVKIFETRLEKELGLKNPVTVNSGTSALHLALVLANVEAGDEVIIPAQTFVATGLIVLQQGALPVFADIDYTTGNISVDSIEKKITKKTKAIIPVHWGGYPCNIDEINELAQENNLAVIEDAAHALGAEYKNQPIGSYSNFTCFSFQAIKHLTTGDGGAICVRDNAMCREAVTRRWFGINRNESPQTLLGERSYNIQSLGYKYHMNDYAAALGIANLETFKNRLNQRLMVADYYKDNLKELDGIRLLNYETDRKSAHWLFGFHVERRIDFIKALKGRGIATSVVHQRIDRNKIFGEIRKDLVNQARFDESQIHIPIHDAIDREKAAYIVESIRQGW